MMKIRILGVSPQQRKAFVAVMATILFMLFISAAVRDVFAADGNLDVPLRSKEHVLMIHDGDRKHGILTTKHTLREALDEAGVDVGDHDITEPRLDEELIGGTYTVTIYRARPVVIIDGGNRTKVMSPYRSAKQIAIQADISIHDEDQLHLEAPQDVIGAGALERLVIDRAKKFTFVFYGTSAADYTQAQTVGEMLKQKDITLGVDDRVRPSVATEISPGMKVELWREGKQTATKKEPVDFPVRQIKDANRNVGYRKVKTPGVKGEKLVTYSIVIKNGKETSRKELKSVTTKQPQEQVEIIGTKPVAVPYTGGGSKSDWLRQAGIPEDMWGYADSIVTRESTWNPNAVNPSSGACGLAQALPCSKVPGNPYNPVDSLRWMNRYVNSRYGGWEGAYNFWQANHWY